MTVVVQPNALAKSTAIAADTHGRGQGFNSDPLAAEPRSDGQAFDVDPLAAPTARLNAADPRKWPRRPE